jgi:hypothetical protein
VILGLLVVTAASLWGTSRILQDPVVAAVASTQEDAARAQQKLFRLMRGAERDPVVVSEAEINAFVSRHLDPGSLPFDRPTVLLPGDDTVALVGQVPIRRLLAESPVPVLADLLPNGWLVRPLWVRLDTHAKFEREPRALLRLDVRRVILGRQRVPTAALHLLFGPGSLWFERMSLPETVADVRIESGRAVIRTTSSRERT